MLATKLESTNFSLVGEIFYDFQIMEEQMFLYIHGVIKLSGARPDISRAAYNATERQNNITSIGHKTCSCYISDN